MLFNDSVNTSPTTNTAILLYKVFFNSIFRNVNVTLLRIMNTPTLVTVCCMSYSFRGEEGRGESVGLAPLFLNFLDPPLPI